MPGFELKSIVWRANREVYGVRKVWKQLNRDFKVARCTVQKCADGTAGRGSGSPV